MAVLLILFFALIGIAVWYVASRTAWLLDIRPLWCYIGYGMALALSFMAMGTYAAKFTASPVMHPLTLINDRLFEYNRGLYHRDAMEVYVSCGSGTYGLPLRIGTDSEVTLLHLLPKE